MGRWALIEKTRDAGGAGLLRAALEALRARGVAVGGVAQVPLVEGDARVGYEARRLGGEGERERVARRPGGGRAAAEEDFCSLVFDGDAFARVARWIDDDLRRAAVVVIDEVSKLEASGRGHARAIEGALASERLVVLCVRADQLFAVVERFSLGEPLASLGRDQPSVDAFVDAVLEARA